MYVFATPYYCSSERLPIHVLKALGAFGQSCRALQVCMYVSATSVRSMVDVVHRVYRLTVRIVLRSIGLLEHLHVVCSVTSPHHTVVSMCILPNMSFTIRSILSDKKGRFCLPSGSSW